MIPLPLTRREATRDDEPFLRTLYASTREDEFANVEWPASVLEAFLRLQYDAQAADYRRRHPHAVQELLLVDGEPAGRLWLHRGEADWHLLDVALLPAFRGLGFGAHALSELLDEASRARASVSLHVAAGNPARRLYERLGFVATGGDAIHQSMTWPAAAARASRAPVPLPLETLS